MNEKEYSCTCGDVLVNDGTKWVCPDCGNTGMNPDYMGEVLECECGGTICCNNGKWECDSGHELPQDSVTEFVEKSYRDGDQDDET